MHQTLSDIGFGLVVVLLFFVAVGILTPISIMAWREVFKKDKS